MTRPSQNIDKKLIKAGKELIRTKGLSRLTVRQVSKKAGVNLGMFNYHFGTKKKFTERILSDLYEDFFSKFSIEVESGGNCYDQLKKAIIYVAVFVRENRHLLESFIEDIINGNKEIADFIIKNMTKHVRIIIRLIKQCQREGYLIKAPLYNILPIILASVVGPNVILRFAEKHVLNRRSLKLLYKTISGHMISDAAIRQRMEIVLKGMATVE